VNKTNKAKQNKTKFPSFIELKFSPKKKKRGNYSALLFLNPKLLCDLNTWTVSCADGLLIKRFPRSTIRPSKYKPFRIKPLRNWIFHKTWC
jgi:hypothetical protein